MRSESPAALSVVEKRFIEIIGQATATENAARSVKEGPITADITLIGDRPAGETNPQGEMVSLAVAAVLAHGFKAPAAPNSFLAFSSTDSNVPISLGIPALTIGSGGKGDRAHSLDEWIDVEKVESVKGMSVGLTMLLAVAGMQ